LAATSGFSRFEEHWAGFRMSRGSSKGRWTTFGNMGRVKLLLEGAHEIVENDPMFRIPRR